MNVPVRFKDLEKSAERLVKQKERKKTKMEVPEELEIGLAHFKE
jgi:hypothetical protein